VHLVAFGTANEPDARSAGNCVAAQKAALIISAPYSPRIWRFTCSHGTAGAGFRSSFVQPSLEFRPFLVGDGQGIEVSRRHGWLPTTPSQGSICSSRGNDLARSRISSFVMITPGRAAGDAGVAPTSPPHPAYVARPSYQHHPRLFQQSLERPKELRRRRAVHGGGDRPDSVSAIIVRATICSPLTTPRLLLRPRHGPGSRRSAG